MNTWTQRLRKKYGVNLRLNKIGAQFEHMKRERKEGPKAPPAVNNLTGGIEREKAGIDITSR